jgi:FAD/FMN-containing dehydrogenase
MSPLPYTALRMGEIGMTQFSSPTDAAIVQTLRQRLSGRVLQPADPEFATARRIRNAAIDRHPRAICICQDAEDVTVALRIAAEHGAAVSVRGGGYNVAGRCVADGALLVDLSRMREVRVDGKARLATVQGGARWCDVDAATAKLELATTGGVISGTGVGGLTLGGGTGWLMRRHGLTLDNLQATTVVLADGRSVRASADENADLFYALRGGAGGFGVVTSFEFQLHPVSEVLAGLLVYPMSEARAALQNFVHFTAEAADEFCGIAILAHAPPLPFLDPAWHGRPVVVVALCWSGGLAAGEQALAPLRRFGAPLADHIGPIPYLQWQQLHDPGAPAGRFEYWKNATYDALQDTTIEQLVNAAEELPTRETEIHVQHLGGAIARVPDADTAFAARRARYFVNLMGATSSAEQFGPMRDRVRLLHERLALGALPAQLPNFTGQDDGDPMARAGVERLIGLRRRYDSNGVFAGSSSPPNR